jgi:transposase InsO family protein
VLKVLRRHGLGTRIQRLGLVAGYAAKPEREVPTIPEPLHLDVEQPGDLVQVDCFYIGRLSGTRGRTWQYTAIDVASSFVWASVQVSEVNPDTKHCSALVRRVASELAAAGWKLKAVSTDNGGEFRAEPFTRAVAGAGAKHRFIRAGRPQTNGCVERVHRTILEECWRPSLALWYLATPRSSETSRPTSATTTTSALTPADAISVARPPSWSMVLGRCAHDEPRLSRHLVRCSS